MVRWSLGKRIMLLAVVGLVLVFSVFSYLGLEAVHQGTGMAFNERLTLAQTLADHIDSSIGYSIDKLEEMAALATPMVEPGAKRKPRS